MGFNELSHIVPCPKNPRKHSPNVPYFDLAFPLSPSSPDSHVLIAPRLSPPFLEEDLPIQRPNSRAYTLVRPLNGCLDTTPVIDAFNLSGPNGILKGDEYDMLYDNSRGSIVNLVSGPLDEYSEAIIFPLAFGVTACQSRDSIHFAQLSRTGGTKRTAGSRTGKATETKADAPRKQKTRHCNLAIAQIIHGSDAWRCVSPIPCVEA